jgi:hypothetical protein
MFKKHKYTNTQENVNSREPINSQEPVNPSAPIKHVFIQKLPNKSCKNVFDKNRTNFRDILNLQEATHKNSWKDGEEFDKERIYAEYQSGDRLDIEMPNYFIGTYLYAYNNHKNIIFSVNDIWSIVTLMLSKYINGNAEKLRDKFVNHTGQKELVVKEFANSEEQSLTMEKQWDYFFEQILDQIKNNTKEGVVNDLINDFSVANTFNKLFSTVTIMDSITRKN